MPKDDKLKFDDGNGKRRAGKEYRSREGVAFVEIDCMPFLGAVPHPTKAGGSNTLYAAENIKGVFTVGYAIHNKGVQRFIKKHRAVALSLVINTNVKAGTIPEVSLRLQAINLVPDDIEGTA